MPLNQAVIDEIANAKVVVDQCRTSLNGVFNKLQALEAIAPFLTQTAQIVSDLNAFKASISAVKTSLDAID